MKKFKVHVEVHHILDDVEASSAEEAKQKACDDYIWDDHIHEVIINVQHDGK